MIAVNGMNFKSKTNFFLNIKNFEPKTEMEYPYSQKAMRKQECWEISLDAGLLMDSDLSRHNKAEITST